MKGSRGLPRYGRLTGARARPERRYESVEAKMRRWDRILTASRTIRRTRDYRP